MTNDAVHAEQSIPVDRVPLAGDPLRQSPRLALPLEPEDTLKDQRYRIEAPLAPGRWGRVYQARDSVYQKTIALRVIPCGPEDAGSVRDRLVWLKNRYDRITDYSQILRVLETEMLPFGGGMLGLVAMDYAEGGGLDSWFQDGRRDQARWARESRRFFHQMVRAVAALHAAGMAHGQLAVKDFLLTSGGIKLADLGGTPILEPNTCSTGDEDHPAGWYSRDLRFLGRVFVRILDPQETLILDENSSLAPETLRRLAQENSIRATPRELEALTLCLNPTSRPAGVCAVDILRILDGTVPTAAEERHCALWMDGQARAAAGDLSAAVAILRELIECRPDHSEARNLCRELEDRLRRADDLLAAVREGLDRLPLPELLELFKRAITLVPGHPQATVLHDLLAGRTHRFDERMKAGHRALGGQDWPQALIHFQEAEKISPGSLGVSRALGVTRRILLDLGECEQEIRQAVRDGRRDQALALFHCRTAYIERTIQSLHIKSREVS